MAMPARNMSFIIFENENLLVVDKPVGIPTHAPVKGGYGLVESLEAERGIKLGVHQRLDSASSGVIAFSKSPRGAESLSKAFELREAKKTYLAIVCGIPKTERGVWSHRFVHQGGKTFEHPDGKFAKASYRVVMTFRPFALLEIRLMTGFTHQLRVQCALAGHPILGDQLYGGGSYSPRMWLHAQRLVLKTEPNLPGFTAMTPRLMQKPMIEGVLDLVFGGIKERLRIEDPDEAIHLLSPHDSGIPELSVEKLGRCFFVRQIEPSGETHWDRESLGRFITMGKKAFRCRDFCYRVHESPEKSGACKAFAEAFSNTPKPFVAKEHGLKYHFDLEGNASGLYLDQRANRAWIMQEAHGSVLNLFAYSCAFSLCAAKSERVTETLSVDSAAAALKRGRMNFELNNMPLQGHRFITEDVEKYLLRCANNSTLFDTIICDPPSFGRSKKGVFRLDESLESLVEACVRVAAPGAILLLSLNHRKIRLGRLRAALMVACESMGKELVDIESFSDEEAQGPLGVGSDIKTIRARFSSVAP